MNDDAHPPEPWRGNAPGEFSLVAGIVAVAFSFFPIIGELVAAPAALVAVGAGGFGLDRWTRGCATNVRAAAGGLVLGVLALIMIVLVYAATSSEP